MPAELADTGSEGAAWRHPAFVAGDFAPLPGDPAEIECLRLAFSATGEAEQRALAWYLILAQQAQGVPRSQRMEERALNAALQGQADPQAEGFLDEVADALDRAAQADDPEHARWLAAWVNRRSARLHPDAWSLSPAPRTGGQWQPLAESTTHPPPGSDGTGGAPPCPLAEPGPGV